MQKKFEKPFTTEHMVCLVMKLLEVRGRWRQNPTKSMKRPSCGKKCFYHVFPSNFAPKSLSKRHRIFLLSFCNDRRHGANIFKLFSVCSQSQRFCFHFALPARDFESNFLQPTFQRKPTPTTPPFESNRTEIEVI